MREPERPGQLAGAAGDHDRQVGLEVADLRQVGVADHEAADEAGVPGVAALEVGRGGVVERGVAGREDRRVVDQPQPGRVQDVWLVAVHGVTLATKHIADESVRLSEA